MKQLETLMAVAILMFTAVSVNAQTAASAQAAASASASAATPAASAPAQAASATANAKASADAKCDCEKKATKPTAKKPVKATAKVEKTVADPLPGRLLTVACDGTIRSAPIPTHETRVELVGNCTPAVMTRAQTVVEDRRVAQVVSTPAVAQATVQASAQVTAIASAGPVVATKGASVCEARSDGTLESIKDGHQIPRETVVVSTAPSNIPAGMTCKQFLDREVPKVARKVVSSS